MILQVFAKNLPVLIDYDHVFSHNYTCSNSHSQLLVNLEALRIFTDLTTIGSDSTVHISSTVGKQS